MNHSCQFLCSELVTVTYEEQPGEIHQAVANLEEISTTSAVVLLEEKPNLGAAICFSLKGRDLFGLITSSVYNATLGWFITVTFDNESQWNRQRMSPKHLFTMCQCSLKDTRDSRARTLENTRNTEENLPVSFVDA
jgi:hypothetical protein